MKNKNQIFLSVIDKKTKEEIIDSIANNYGISKTEAIDEVTSEESEHLLDYLSGPIRSAVSLLFKRYALA